LFVGEWDCSDGSDEQRLQIMNRLNKHNSKLMNLTELKEQCDEQYQLDNIPFSDICDISSEYPCFRTGIDDPLNITKHRPCINLTQIGDGKTDCLTGLDERNRLQCTGFGMLGFHFQFNASVCVSYTALCDFIYPWTPSANAGYDTVCFHQKFKFLNGTNGDCKSLSDVMCLNDVCIKNARCNGQMECPHGEDEYRCVPSTQSILKYRMFKKIQIPVLQLQNYPSRKYLLDKIARPSLIKNERNNLFVSSLNLKSTDDLTRVFGLDNSKNKTVYEIVRDSVENGEIEFEKFYLPFICNRGVAVKYYTGHTVCFCSSSYYGEQCQYYNDRITVVTHLDLKNSPSSLNVIKVLTTFLFGNEIIDYYEFHVDPKREIENNYIKQQIYFRYPRLKQFLHMKKTNRSGTQLYNVQFEAFDLHSNGNIEIIGVWKYRIYFDFLPSFRLSKILHFLPEASLSLNDPCSNHSCSQNGICQKIINSNDLEYFCLCKSGYYGISCQHYDQKCHNYCSPKSICKPKSRGILTDNQDYPLCLCPTATFGIECYLKNVNCEQNPCLNGGTCIVTYDFTDINKFICICTDLFEGIHCEIPKGMINIRFILSPNSEVQTDDVIAATVFYSDYEIPSLRFLDRHQKVYAGFPSELKLIYDDKVVKNAPTTAVLKVYGRNFVHDEAKYFVLYFYSNEKEINLTIDLTLENHCPLVETLWYLVETIEKTGKFVNIN
jgi:hypothetical protein